MHLFLLLSSSDLLVLFQNCTLSETRNIAVYW